MMGNPVRHYRLLASALPHEEKRIRTLYTPSLLLAISVPSIVFVLLGIRGGATPKSLFVFALAIALLLVYSLLWAPRRLKRRLRKCWDGYDLEIGQDYMVRRQPSLPDLRLPFEKIRRLEHTPGRYLRVTGTPSNNVVSIPEGIEGFAEIVTTLSSVQPIRVVQVQQWLKYRTFMGIGLVFFMLMLWATSPAVVIPLSVVVAGMIVWAFRWYQRNPNISRKTKWVSWMYLPFLLVCALKVLVALFP